MAKFTTLQNAKAYQSRAIKPMIIIIGDDGLIWVVSMRDGNRLIKNGYEAV